ncbi:helix-turn-helix domain-containing protein [Carboxylicivirga sp. RSCT41]|uniref:helix-turn-helix domain-containing protein n=1 Tax=Carboxylicivirga agarovorans TaxID=3417570 RepID=UPI003D35363B
MKFHCSGDYFEGVSVILTLEGIKSLTGIYPCHFKNSMVTYSQLTPCLQVATQKLKSFETSLSKFTFLYQILKNRFLSKEQSGYDSFSFPGSYNPSNNYSAVNLAEELGLSYRTLHRHFNNKVGISPKEYLKLIRIDNTCKLIAHTPDFSWSNIMDKGGYYDQAHFIREFKQMMGMTPSNWHKNNRNGLYINRFYSIET